MKEYTIKRVNGAPDWEKIPALQISEPALHSPILPIRAQAQIAWDDTALHVRLSAAEADIRAEETDPLGQPCLDSCLEFFFSPVAGDDRYFNVECNPNGLLYLGIGRDIQSLIRLFPVSPAICPACRRTQDGWETVYDIPYSFIRFFFPAFTAASGAEIRANCYKCGDMTVKPHHYTWSPLPEDLRTFHCTPCFGKMILE